jgi:predicted nucleotidyltransferase
MDRARIVARLKQLEPCLRQRGISALFLYGSHARGDARGDSDIDLLVDFADGQPPDFARFMDAYADLEEAFPGTEIGFSTRNGLEPTYRPHIEASAVRVF